MASRHHEAVTPIVDQSPAPASDEATIAKLLATMFPVTPATPYVPPTTGKTLIALFDELMALPEGKRPGLHRDYVLALEGQVAFFWMSEATNKGSYSRRNLAGIYIIDINPELRRSGVFTKLLQHMADHKEVAHVAVADAHTDNIQACLNKLVINGHRFRANDTDYTWCAKGGCEHGDDTPTPSS